MTNVLKAVAVLFLLSIVSFSAAGEETMQTRQNPLYAVVLQESAGDYEPDYEALGGTIERRWKHRAFVSLPQSAVDVLLLDAQVKFIQRVYTGDPLPDVLQQPRKQGEREIRTEWAAPTWSSGNYNYDGAGNIKSIDRQGISGTDGQIDRYAYDLAGRLLYGTINGPFNYENYKYDSFGNVVQTQSSARPTMATPASLSTNRLEGAGYDRAGNLTTPAGTAEKFIYDSFNMVRAKARPNVAGNVELYLYTATDERLAVDTLGITTWMIRDLGGKVLREWHGWGAPDAWFWEQDYIYRDGQLVAAERQSVEGGTRHFHVDHLGTSRLITNDLGQKMATHDYFPFGVELSDFRQEMTDRGLPRPEPMKFTGHERDFTGGTSANHLDYIDYMHGRYYDPIRGRFLSADPVLDVKRSIRSPQMWNRYTYVRNNPLTLIDPTGKIAELPSNCIDSVPCKEIRDVRNTLPFELRLYVRATRLSDGRTVIDKQRLNSASDRLIDSTGNGGIDFSAYRSLQGVVNSTKTVRIDSSSATALIAETGLLAVQKIDWATSGTAKSGTLVGYTLTPSQSGSANVLVQLNPNQTQRELAGTMAHELYVHALREISGLPHGHEDVPDYRFNDAENEAYRNYDRLP